MAISEKLLVKIGVDLKDFEKKMGSVSKTLKNTGRQMSEVGTKMTKGITLPIIAGFAAIGKAATDLEATEAKYETVFAGMTDVTDEFIDKFQELTPATQAEAQSMASNIQDLLVPMGFLREDATELTGEFLNVAGALANFNSGTHTSQDVVGALQSALVGSFEPLRSLGVQLSKTTIIEKALEKGLISTKDELTKQIEAQVVLDEVYAQSGDALAAYTEENLDAKTKMGLMKTEIIDVAAQIGKVLLPIISDITEKIRGWTEKFASLDEKTQKTILVVAGLVAALGPALIIIGKLIGAVGTISGIFGGASIAAGVTGTAIAGTGVAAGGALVAILPFIAGIAALVAAGVLLYNYFKKDAIPEVERFGDTVSDSTQQSVGAFMDLEEEATTSLNELAWGGMAVTEEMANSISENFSQMGSQIVSELETQKAESSRILNELFAESSEITKEGIDEMLMISNQGYTDRILATETASARINEILDTAAAKNIGLTRAEEIEITAIKQEMLDNAVEILSESELEQAAIMERMRINAGTLTALQAAEVVANSVEARDGTIAAAEDSFNEQLKIAAQLRLEGTQEAEDMADAIIEEAERQRDGAVSAATDMHDDIVEQAKLQSKEHIAEVDWETGEILSKWDLFVKTLKEYASEAGGARAAASFAGKFGNVSAPEPLPGINVPQFATGTNFVPSTGLALIHQGEAIIPADQNPFTGGDSFNGGGNNATINIYPQTITESTVDYLFNRFNARLGVEI